MKLKIILSILLFSIPLLAPAEDGDYRKKISQDVLTRLFEFAGQYNFRQPVIELTKENKRVAAYFADRNRIILDEKAYGICQTFGKDSLSALAFIIGHEMIHSFQTEIRDRKASTNFLSYDKQYDSGKSIETVADIQGIFTAFLAGYKMKTVVPEMVDRIYEAYGLKNKNFSSYPSFEERSQSALIVLETVSRLIDLFEASNYLIVCEEYSLASESLEYILQYYQGREIYNNLGVLYLLSAMELYNHATDRFIYPIEMDASTQLKKLEKSRGVAPLSREELNLRNKLLEKGVNYFKVALIRDKDYISARLNLTCALNLQSKPQEAKDYFKKAGLNTKKKTAPAGYEKAQLVYGITWALLGDNRTSGGIFSELMKSDIKLISAEAKYNMDVLHKKDISILISPNQYYFSNEFASLINSIKLEKTSDATPIAVLNNDSGINLRKVEKGETTTLSFWDDMSSIVTIARFKNTQASNFNAFNEIRRLDKAFFYNMVTTPDGYYLKSEENKVTIGLKVSIDGKVQEIFKIRRS